MAYWILKTEPKTFSFDDLLREGRTVWDGVRNYQARNNLRSMRVGDLCLIYHSVGPKALVGMAQVCREAYPEPKGGDLGWVVVDIEPIRRLKRPVSLHELKTQESMRDLSLVRQSRLSVCPVRAKEWNEILSLENRLE